MTMPQGLTPVATPSLNAWRVPMWVEDEEYTVCVEQNKLRMYDAETLPDFIKASMSMIHAFQFEPPKVSLFGWSDPRVMLGHEPQKFGFAYHNTQDPRLDDIGWRCTWNLYMLILTPEQLESMNG